MSYLLYFLVFSAFSFDFIENACTDGEQLELISDLLPDDCYANRQDYKIEDCFPKCMDFSSSNPSKCSRLNKPSKDLLAFKPKCDKDGTYSAVQCKDSTGRCFCFDPEGTRIFGQSKIPEAQNMTCACSRKKYELRKANINSFISLHCNAAGNYEPLQCDIESEQCWCVEEKTGKLTSQIVPQSAITRLPCYNYQSIGTQYLRQCESMLYARTQISDLFAIHGARVKYGVLLCDEDGSFGSYRVTNGLAYCTWRDNSNLGTWQSGADNLKELNCNCARDSRYVEGNKKMCLGNGNYKTYQTEGENGYCVDSDGAIFKENVATEDDCGPKISLSL